MNKDTAAYWIRRVGSSPDGTQWYCNVAYDVEGKCLGGDAHWLTVGLADRALQKRLEYNRQWRVGKYGPGSW
jgi:hypothetical protein